MDIVAAPWSKANNRGQQSYLADHPSRAFQRHRFQTKATPIMIVGPGRSHDWLARTKGRSVLKGSPSTGRCKIFILLCTTPVCLVSPRPRIPSDSVWNERAAPSRH